MTTAKKAKFISGVAIVTGLATMVFSNNVAESSALAAVITFVIGLTVVGVGVVKVAQTAVFRG